MQPLSPVEERIQSLDVIRGFALLGILLMNIQSFSMPGAAYLNPYAYGDMQGANFWVWTLTHIIADQKFMGIFSMLFGVGVLIFSQGIEAKGLASAPMHYRRNAWLLLFGLIHGYLFWYGDILFSYALCALWVYLLRNKSVRTLFLLGILFIAISSILNTLTGLAIPNMPAAEVTGMSRHWSPSPVLIEKEISAYTSGWFSALEQRAGSTFFMQTYVFLTTFVWRAGGMMLIGMALYKSGFFNNKNNTGRYLLLFVCCAITGLLLIFQGLKLNHMADFSLEFSMFLGSQYNYWGSAFLAVAYVALLMLVINRQWFPRLQTTLAAVGKMAFTQYFFHTLVCTTLFYQFGQLGEFTRVEQLMLVIGIWIFQLAVSPIWLEYFRYGPLEWCWRSLTYWQLQPFKRQQMVKAY